MKTTQKNSFKPVFAIVCLLFCFSRVCPGQETATPKNMITAGANFFYSANADFRQIYGQAVFMPEIKITRLVSRNIFIWGSCAFIAKNGFIEEVDEKAKIHRTMLCIGVGYAHKFSASLRLRGELGFTSISFKEEALGGTFKGSGLGWKIGTNLDYFIGKRMFVTLTAAYSGASDEAETGKIRLGGVHAGLCLGFTF